MISANRNFVRPYQRIIEQDTEKRRKLKKEHLMSKSVIFLSFCDFSFLDQFQQYLQFNICETDDITLKLLRNRRPYIAQFVKLMTLQCSINRK